MRPTIRIVADQAGPEPSPGAEWPEAIKLQLQAAKGRLEKACDLKLTVKTEETRFRAGVSGVVSYEWVLEHETEA